MDKDWLIIRDSFDNILVMPKWRKDVVRNETLFMVWQFYIKWYLNPLWHYQASFVLTDLLPNG